MSKPSETIENDNDIFMDDFDETKLIYNTALFENENYQKIINFRTDYL